MNSEPLVDVVSEPDRTVATRKPWKWERQTWRCSEPGEPCVPADPCTDGCVWVLRKVAV